MEYAAFSGIDLSYLDSLWRRVRIPCHEDQFKIQEVFKLYFHFPVHYASVDTGGRMAELI